MTDPFVSSFRCPSCDPHTHHRSNRCPVKGCQCTGSYPEDAARVVTP